jgi:hypothetical protein
MFYHSCFVPEGQFAAKPAGDEQEDGDEGGEYQAPEQSSGIATT